MVIQSDTGKREWWNKLGKNVHDLRTKIRTLKLIMIVFLFFGDVNLQMNSVETVIPSVNVVELVLNFIGETVFF